MKLTLYLAVNLEWHAGGSSYLKTYPLLNLSALMWWWLGLRERLQGQWEAWEAMLATYTRKLGLYALIAEIIAVAVIFGLTPQRMVRL